MDYISYGMKITGRIWVWNTFYQDPCTHIHILSLSLLNLESVLLFFAIYGPYAWHDILNKVLWVSQTVAGEMHGPLYPTILLLRRKPYRVLLQIYGSADEVWRMQLAPLQGYLPATFVSVIGCPRVTVKLDGLVSSSMCIDSCSN